MFGDVAAAFIPFEKDLTLLVEDEGMVEEDGFVTRKPDTEITFKGILQKITSSERFNMVLNLGVPGSRHLGDVVLYCRLGQTNMPTINIGDKVRDTDGNIWKVEGTENYEQWNVILYSVVKVN